MRTRETNPQQRRAGLVSQGIIGPTEEITMRCECGTVQTQALDANASIRKALAEVVCLFCGRQGAMKRARAGSEPNEPESPPRQESGSARFSRARESA